MLSGLGTCRLSDSEEDILEVATVHGAVDSVEVWLSEQVQLPEIPVPAMPQDDSDSDSKGEDARGQLESL